MAVSVTTPRAEQFARTVVATGSIYAWQEAIIGPEVGGYRVAEVNVDVGDKVRKGQELVRLSAEMLEAEVASKRAAKAQARGAAHHRDLEPAPRRVARWLGRRVRRRTRAPEERRARGARARRSRRSPISPPPS